MQKIIYALSVCHRLVFSPAILLILLTATIALYTTTALAQEGQQQRRDSSTVKKILSPAELQQRQRYFEHKSDSMFVVRQLRQMKSVFTLSPEQEKLLSQSIGTLNAKRREVFKAYWKKEGFREQMLKVDQNADSLFRSLIGEKNLRIYKDTMQSRLLQRQQLMQQQGKFYKVDTMESKTVTKPLN